MKITGWIAAIISVVFCLLFLTSCDVHFGSVHYDVPWWVIALPISLIFLVIWRIGGKGISSHKYVCPKCLESFYPEWWAAGVSLHINDDRYFKCPYCKKRSFCRREDKSRY